MFIQPHWEKSVFLAFCFCFHQHLTEHDLGKCTSGPKNWPSWLLVSWRGPHGMWGGRGAGLGGCVGSHVGEEPYHGPVDENEDNPCELVLHVQTTDRINNGSIWSTAVNGIPYQRTTIKGKGKSPTQRINEDSLLWLSSIFWTLSIRLLSLWSGERAYTKILNMQPLGWRCLPFSQAHVKQAPPYFPLRSCHMSDQESNLKQQDFMKMSVIISCLNKV